MFINTLFSFFVNVYNTKREKERATKYAPFKKFSPFYLVYNSFAVEISPTVDIASALKFREFQVRLRVLPPGFPLRLRGWWNHSHNRKNCSSNTSYNRRKICQPWALCSRLR